MSWLDELLTKSGLTYQQFMALSAAEQRDLYKKHGLLNGQRQNRRGTSHHAPPPPGNGTRGPNPGQPTPPSTWQPINLWKILHGKQVPEEPGIGLPRADGLRLLYPGKEHTVIGEMESGKSWYAAGCAAAELIKGNRVVWVHFEEADPTDTVQRLRDLGVSIDVILSKFTFVGPDEKVTPEALAALLDPAPSLVVFDGVSEAMYLHGWMGNDTDGAAAYRRHLVKPCTAAGAAVLSADHVPKDQDKQGRSAIGSIHKGNGLTGSLIKLENVEAFGRDRRGASKVFVTKDRPGYLLRHGRPDKKRTPGKTYMGMLVVDDTRQWVQYLDLAFLAPREEDEAAGADGQDDPDEVAVLAAVVKLTKKGVPANVNKILATARINRTRGIAALTRLELRGGVTMTVQGQAHVFTVPETGSEDHSSATTGETP